MGDKRDGEATGSIGNDVVRDDVPRTWPRRRGREKIDVGETRPVEEKMDEKSDEEFTPFPLTSARLSRDIEPFP